MPQTQWSEALGRKMLADLEGGATLTSLGKRDECPTVGTIRRWSKGQNGVGEPYPAIPEWFIDGFEPAREAGDALRVDEAVDIVDELKGPDAGNPSVVDVRIAEVRAKTRLQASAGRQASKPQRYQHEHSGPGGAPVAVAATVTPDLAKAAEAWRILLETDPKLASLTGTEPDESVEAPPNETLT